MAIKEILLTTLTFLAILSIFGALFERPVVLSYITSNSMSPTLNKDDLIVINPVSRDFKVGDIIVFYTGEKWVCHRIYAKVDNGFLTKGDNNIAVDQIEGVPPIKPEKIAGKVVTLGKYPLKIPGIGSKIEVFSKLVLGNKYLALVFFSVLGGYYFSSSKKLKRRRRKYVKLTYQQAYTIAAVFVLIVFSLVSTSIIREVEIGYGTTLAGNSKPGWVYPGEVFTREIEVRNNAVIPMIFTVTSDSERAEIHEIFLLYPGEKRTIAVKIHAPRDTNIYYERILVGKFLPMLPLSWVSSLSKNSVYLVVLVEITILAVLLIFVYKLSEVRERYRIRLRVMLI